MDKACSKCEITKPLEEFGKAGKGHRSECTACRRLSTAAYREARRDLLAEKSRNHHHANREQVLLAMWAASLVRNYGITAEDYWKLFEEQGGVCALCFDPPDGRRLSVDHDHETGRIRGLLCVGCNTALGVLGDNEAGILRVLDYLQIV